MHVEKIGFEANPKHTVGYRLVVYHGSGWSRHAWTCASGTSDRFMNSYLAPRMPSFVVAKLRNSWLLRVLGALNLNILHHHLLRPESVGDSFTQAIAALFLSLQRGVQPHLSGAGIRDAGAISGLECTAMMAAGLWVRAHGGLDDAGHAEPAWQVPSVR